MLIGREPEQRALCKAIAERSSLLVCGPAGSGKTALLEAVLGALAANQRRACIVCAADGTPGLLWRRLVQALAKAGDEEVLTRVERESGSSARAEAWIQAQTSLRLRGVLRRAARARDYAVFLDTAEALADGTYRLLQEWVWSGRTPVILLGRGETERELGKAARLFWHEGLRLRLGALEPRFAEALLESAIERFSLARFADAAFRGFVLEQSGRLPGPIVRLCEMASQAAYQCGEQVKLHTLAVDFLLHDLHQPVPRTLRHV